MQVSNVIPVYVWIFLYDISLQHINQITVVAGAVKLGLFLLLIVGLLTGSSSGSVFPVVLLGGLSPGPSLDWLVVVLVNIIVARTS